jgi:hypothetical protein
MAAIKDMANAARRHEPGESSDSDLYNRAHQLFVGASMIRSRVTLPLLILILTVMAGSGAAENNGRIYIRGQKHLFAIGG